MLGWDKPVIERLPFLQRCITTIGKFTIGTSKSVLCPIFGVSFMGGSAACSYTKYIYCMSQQVRMAQTHIRGLRL